MGVSKNMHLIYLLFYLVYRETRHDKERFDEPITFSTSAFGSESLDAEETERLREEQEDSYKSVFGESYGRMSMQDILEQKQTLKGPSCPPAVGRSGTRLEKGMKASGLIGERLRQGEEGSDNSQVQRAWLVGGDAALDMRVSNTVPVLDISKLDATTLPGLG